MSQKDLLMLLPYHMIDNVKGTLSFFSMGTAI